MRKVADMDTSFGARYVLALIQGHVGHDLHFA